MDSSIYDNLKSLMAVIRDERTPLANTANRVGTALMAIVDALGLLDSEKQDGATDAFLSKKNDDTAAGVISFLQSINVTGRAVLNGGIQLGDALLLYDSENNAVKVCDRNGATMNFYATGGVSTFGFSGSDEGGGGSVDVELILQSGVPIATVAGVTIYAPETSSGGGGASTWDELSGKPSWVTDTKPSVSAFANDAGYITSAALAGYVLSSSLGSLAYKSKVGATDIADYAVLEDKIGSGAVTTNKLADLAITTAKLADASIVAQKIADAAVTNAKLQHSSMRLWGADVALGASHDGDILLGSGMGVRLTDGTKTAWIKYDSENNALYVEDNDGNAVNFYATGGVSAYGHSGIEQGGGGTVDVEQILTSGTPIATVAGITLYAPEADTSQCVASLAVVSTYDIGYYNNNTLLGQLTVPYAKITEGIGKPYGDFPGLRSYYWDKSDNSGYPTYLLISKVCAASEWSNWGAGHPMYGISGTVYGRRSGNMNGTGTWHVNAAVSYSADYIKAETSDATYMQPCVVTYGGNVYVALRLLGSGYDMMFLGSGYNLLDTPIQVRCTDLSGTCPSVTVLRDYIGVNLTATALSATSLTSKYDITTTDGNLSVARSATVQGETHLNGSVYLPDAYTFFGGSGIYVHANRPGQYPYGDAAYIGIHENHKGTDTVATVNLDGTVRLWHCLAINQDPDADASLRVGGLTKLDYLTLGGITRPDGYWFAAPSGYFGNPSSGTYTSFGDEGIELSHATPFIDFHYGKSTADYTSRLIASEDGVLMIDSATADPALRIGNAYLRYDTVNNALYVTGQDGAQINFYATGNLAGFSGLDGGSSELTNVSLTGQLTAASVNTSDIHSDNDIYIDAHGEYIYLNGSTAYVDADGWICTNELHADDRVYVHGGGVLNVGGATNSYNITDFYADGTYVYITINGKRYRFTPSSTTIV